MNDRSERKSSPLATERLLENSATFSSSADNFVRSSGARCAIAPAAYESDFARAFASRKPYEIDLRAPLPAGAIRKQSLEVAVKQVRRLESDDLDPG